MALKLGEKLQRITDVYTNGAVVHCTVETQSQISSWNFSVDFNNWGHITGTFWTYSENNDSSIPHKYGMILSGWIHDLLNERNIHIEDMSDEVDCHNNLGQMIDTGTYNIWGLLRFVGLKALKNNTQIQTKNSDYDMRGELFLLNYLITDSRILELRQ